MFTMKQVCDQVGITYEALKFYCNEGLVPNVKRNQNNHRIFSEKDVAWLKGLICLKNCGMSIETMKEYLALCLEGLSSIPQRQRMLERQRSILDQKIADLQEAVDYIDQKQAYYGDVLSGKVKYNSNLLATED